MSLSPGHDQDDTEQQADKQATEMKDQLRKEVALWSASRDDTSARQSADLTLPVPPRSVPRPAKQSSRAKKAAAAPAATPAAGPKKPFSMSFDGVTDAQHISYMIARGAR